MTAKTPQERQLRTEIRYCKEALLLARHEEGYHELRQAQREHLPAHIRPLSEQANTDELQNHISRLEADLEQLQNDDWTTAVIDSQNGVSEE